MQTLSAAPDTSSSSQTLRLERPIPTRPTDRLAMRVALWLLLWSTRTPQRPTAQERCDREITRRLAAETAERQRADVLTYTATLPALR